MRHPLVPLSIIIALSVLGACARKPPMTAIDRMDGPQLIEAAQYAARVAQSVAGHKAKSTQKSWAIKGKAYAARCIEISPETPECYYWRAVNTGLYHQVRVIGYQDGIKQMLKDCELMIDRGRGDYDHAGPYRIQGQIYTQLPQTGGRPDSVVRDLDKALLLLEKAVEIAPTYPENRIALAQALYFSERYDEANDELIAAKREVHHWRFDASYFDWQKTIASLTRKIDRKN